MSQMVLPQNLSKNTPSEASGSANSSAAGTEKSAGSRFDEVSRSEQQRLEAKRAEKAQKSDETADKAAAADSASGRKADESSGKEKGQSVAAEGGQNNPDQALRDKFEPDESALITATEEATSKENDAEIATVTFAGLQSLVKPTQAGQVNAASMGGSQNSAAVQNAFLQGALTPGSALSGNNSGKGGSSLAQASGQKGITPGAALSETLLAGAVGEGANKPSDSPILQNAIRFQGALESLTGQANAVNAPKMAPDAPVLRGYATSIDVPVSHAEWGDKMAGKLTFLTARNMSVAEIHLTPPDMGPMEVRVQVQQDQANITVHSANPVVRDQLELHSHRLRDMLNEQGFSLEQFDVSDSSRDQAGEGESGGQGNTGEGLMAGSDIEEGTIESQSLDLTWKGEVDIFA